LREDKSKVLGCSHISALPGYAVAGLTYPDNEIFLDPVIAWVLVTRQYGKDEDDPITTITPVTLDGDREENAPVVYPDGTVRLFNGGFFQTVESWKENEIGRQQG
jgi:hypothetical protein